MFVVTADQVRSRSSHDRVPEALASLRSDLAAAGPGLTHGVRLSFERTAGDEIQGLLDRPEAALEVLTTLLRLREWRVGIGVGDVDHPLPRSTREANGPAFVAARAAVEASRRSPHGVAVRAATDPGGWARNAEAALWLLAGLLTRRTPTGWETTRLLRTGMTQRAAAAHLDISESAVSQRATAAGWTEELRGRELCTVLLGAADAA